MVVSLGTGRDGETVGVGYDGEPQIATRMTAIKKGVRIASVFVIARVASGFPVAIQQISWSPSSLFLTSFPLFITLLLFLVLPFTDYRLLCVHDIIISC